MIFFFVLIAVVFYLLTQNFATSMSLSMVVHRSFGLYVLGFRGQDRSWGIVSDTPQPAGGLLKEPPDLRSSDDYVCISDGYMRISHDYVCISDDYICILEVTLVIARQIVVI